MKRFAVAAALISLAFAVGCAQSNNGNMVLASQGRSIAPIIIAADAPPSIHEAADDLAKYIEKISGARPDILTGRQVPVPVHAIWLGLQPQSKKVFPAASLSLNKPEEILLLCDGRNLLLAGRDRMIGETEIEAGTCNAVYTFLQKNLGVRWLWPGPLGEDVIKQKTIAVAPFHYQYAPQFRQREVIMHWVWRWFEYDMPVRQELIDWVRAQRFFYDSLETESGHPMADWWEMYHETHPEWMALQPDGTRGTYPDPTKTPWFVKMCQSNPGVAQQWLENVVKSLEEDPSLETFGGSANDAAFSGVCVCDDCRAWDDPNGKKYNYSYAGGPVEYVSMSDRYVTFWNILAKKLKERFPGRNFSVVGSAYGCTMEPPISTPLDDNIIMHLVGNFPLNKDSSREEQKSQWLRWAEKAHTMTYRPNLWYFGGGGWGFPEIALEKTIEDYRFLANNSCVGITVDMNRNYWAVHGPQTYLMSHLAWDPMQDAHALMADYYRRGFGTAAGEIERYWKLMDAAHDKLVGDPDYREGSAGRMGLPPIFERVYTPELLDQADALLDQAAAKTAGAPEIYSKRVAFVRSGFDVYNLMARTMPIMTRVRESQGKDVEAVKQAVANWDKIKQICAEAGPHAIRFDHFGINQWLIENGYMAGMQDYFGPPSDEFRKAAGLE